MVPAKEVQPGLARDMDHPEVESVPLYEEELVLAVGVGHAFAERRSVDLEELGGERLILFDRASGNHEITRSLFEEAGLAEPEVVELDNIEAAKRMVEHDLGVSFLPRSAVLQAVASGRLRTVGVEACPKLRRSIVALRRKDVPPTGAAASFLSLVGDMDPVPDDA